MMAKRKRNTTGESATAAAVAPIPSKKVKSAPPPPPTTAYSPAANTPITLQIITGSYERVLHGITATIPLQGEVEFADTFLFTAHLSAVRCLALSPPSAPTPGQTQKVILASGSTDQGINLYHLSAHAPSGVTVPAMPSFNSRPTVENPSNRELGTLGHHASSITGLYFPSRGKLLSSAEDSTIAVTRTRDWTLLSTIKVPIPKAVGRPSGDTAPLGGAPSGVNDFAVHPSMKLMISVGKGEKSMRLWNLVTGKKAGVLNFERGMLGEVGEGRFSSGEGRKVAWGNTDAGEEFCVAFERGVLVYGMDSKVKCKVVPEPRTKIHQLRYVQVQEQDDIQVMAVSTEDGRILFYSTRPADLRTATATEGKESPLPAAKLVAQLGGKDVDVSGRIKDFTIIPVGEGTSKKLIIITGNSDGSVKIWTLLASDLTTHEEKVKQVGKIMGSCETSKRITCLQAFIMLPRLDAADEELEEFEGFDDAEEDGNSSSSDSE